MGNMIKGRVWILLCFAAALAVATGMHLFPTKAADNSQEPATTSSPALPAEKAAQLFGMTLQLHGPNYDNMYHKLIDEIAQTSVNTVSLVVAAYQENCSSTSIFIDIRKVPSDQQLKEIINYAHSKGLKVTLMPIVLLENPKSGEWRGKINPDNGNWVEWWEDYTNYIMHYTYIAAETGVELLMVGSELISTETQTDRWKALIAQVRAAYKGYLSYSSNWDHYNVPQFWCELDIIGMTTYYDLCGDKQPTEAVLKNSWASIREKILDWRRTKNISQPILFTEVGWPNQETAAQYSWDYYRAQDRPDPQLQARCFKAFFDTWSQEPCVGGYLIWEWRTSLQQATAPVKDTTYVPKDKPAMDVINAFFLSQMNGTTQPAIAADGSSEKM